MIYDYTLKTDDIQCMRRLFAGTISDNITRDVKQASITFKNENGLFKTECYFETMDEKQGAR